MKIVICLFLFMSIFCQSQQDDDFIPLPRPIINSHIVEYLSNCFPGSDPCYRIKIDFSGSSTLDSNGTENDIRYYIYYSYEGSSFEDALVEYDKNHKYYYHYVDISLVGDTFYFKIVAKDVLENVSSEALNIYAVIIE